MNSKKHIPYPLSSIAYFVDGKKRTVRAKVLKNPLEKALGLMFQKNSPPLFFTSNTLNYNPITSIFCKPFKAIWLDENMRATKIIEVKKPDWISVEIQDMGKYWSVLAIPEKGRKQGTVLIEIKRAGIA